MIWLRAGWLVLLGLTVGCIPSNSVFTPPAQCHAVPDTGLCRAAITRYFYNPDSTACEAFIWGGCGGTVPFHTSEECRATCLKPQ